MFVDVFLHCVGGRNVHNTVLSFFFSVFIFSVPSKVIVIVIECMFLGLNIFWALPRAHFKKVSLSLAQDIFMPANINSIALITASVSGDSLNSPSKTE